MRTIFRGATVGPTVYLGHTEQIGFLTMHALPIFESNAPIAKVMVCYAHMLRCEKVLYHGVGSWQNPTVDHNKRPLIGSGGGDV